MLLFTILMNILVLPLYENYLNSLYNISVIPKNTQKTSIKSRLLAQTQNHNPDYHNDPELKEIIDKLNDETIKTYQKTHDPYKQLQELVEKKGTKLSGGNGAEPMSTIEKDLLETYEKMFGEQNHKMIKSGMYKNDDEKYSTCECTDINNTDLTKIKGKDKYLKHLKHRCTGGICSCSLCTAILTMLGLACAKAGASAGYGETIKNGVSSSPIFKLFQNSTILSALKAIGARDRAEVVKVMLLQFSILGVLILFPL
ncbi:stevor PIR protein, putative [Plasmodium reichenowi]|uniref:Stevor PIR protein, putative n=1 Tax=Plasmodium reichenowi TaxID=5854 RepID=A0A2P9D2J2_PLARE|nr:stevor PIR protein, putative [Plasmodium reichenowi]